MIEFIAKLLEKQVDEEVDPTVTPRDFLEALAETEEGKYFVEHMRYILDNQNDTLKPLDTDEKIVVLWLRMCLARRMTEYQQEQRSHKPVLTY